MTNGKHIRSPYNFVPLSGFVHLLEGETADLQDVPFEDGWCGEIELELTALSDLLVSRGTERGAGLGEAHMFALKRPEGARLAIPGSSMRGMIRSVVEIASFGKMGRVDNRRFGVRDLTDSGDFYRKRISHVEYLANGKKVREADSVKEKILDLTPLARSGWLRLKVVDGQRRWVVRECKYGRIEFDDLKDYGLGWADARSKHDKRRVAVSSFLRRRNLAVKHEVLHCKAVMPELGAHYSHSLSEEPRLKSYLIFMEVAGVRPLSDQVRSEHEIVDGYLVFTNVVGKKKRDFFFFGHDEFEDVVVDDDVMRAFQEINPTQIRGDEAASQQTPWGFWKSELLQGRLGEEKGREPGIPVFFLAGAPKQSGGPMDIQAVGLSQMLKLPYDLNVHEMIGNTSPDHLSQVPDMAEVIFGAVANSSDSSGWRGRVSFSHLEVQGPLASDVERAPTARLILNSPKPSFYPAYVEQSGGAEVSTYLRPLAIEDEAIQQDDPDSVADEALTGSELRGWKRYQVVQKALRPTELIYKPENSFNPKSDRPPERPRAGAGDKLATRLHPVPAGTRFVGTMHVHNLRPKELGALMWALGLGEDVTGAPEARRYNHGIGMGKPFGFGRCAVRVAGGRLEPNRPSLPAVEGGELAEELAGAKKAFEEDMEKHYSAAVQARGKAPIGAGEVSWSQSPQIQALRMLTCPERHPRPVPYPVLIQSGYARHAEGRCEWLRPQNDFRDAKKDRIALEPVADNSVDRQRFGRPTVRRGVKPTLPDWLK